jgi:peptidoglycan hydrolase-like protein with peptidoglycan-binding domain
MSAPMRCAPLSVAALAVVLGLTLWAGCDQHSAEQRARQAAEKMKESLPDIDGAALAQKLPPEVVKQLQEQLTIVKEYQGEISGEFDSVTVNALEAFQRSHGLKDDGVLTDQTKRRLEEAAAGARRGEG